MNLFDQNPEKFMDLFSQATQMMKAPNGMLPMQGLGKLMQLYSTTTMAHLQNNYSCWQSSVANPNFSDNLTHLMGWYQKRLEINEKFLHDLLETSTEVQTETLELLQKLPTTFKKDGTE